ncbi:MAG: hypothetical protein K2P88_11760 [Chitinophagaceae bacterium]|uniref:SulP family inorganic anion transporter n=1 Tax=unclassified Paraflavitalea TaxID=2798305 RepID=UPI003D333A4C|nr:hypothetical protein [Chitinophagaceae bacterium]
MKNLFLHKKKYSKYQHQLSQVPTTLKQSFRLSLSQLPIAAAVAMAMGFRPEVGLIGLLLSVLSGAIFGINRMGYSLALVPILAGFFATEVTGANPFRDSDYTIWVAAALISGLLVLLFSIFDLKKFFDGLPATFKTGFSIVVVISIWGLILNPILGISSFESSAFFSTGWIAHLYKAVHQIHKVNDWSVYITAVTVFAAMALSNFRTLIPASFGGMIAGTVLSLTILGEKNIVTWGEVWGNTVSLLPVFFEPMSLEWNFHQITQLVYLSCSITVVALFELNASNSNIPRGAFTGMGFTQILSPIIGGGPVSGIMNSDSIKIKEGVATPVLLVSKLVFTTVVAVLVAPYLIHVPVAVFAGLLLFVSIQVLRTVKWRTVWKSDNRDKIRLGVLIMVGVFVNIVIGLITTFTVHHIMKAYSKRKAKRAALLTT